MFRLLPFSLLLFAGGPAAASVTTATDTAFVIEHKLTVAAAPAKLWDTLLQPGGWWEDEHTYSGDSANMSIDARPGGCWCERAKGGGIEHMRVIYADQPTTLRMAGALGPLQESPVNGVLTIEIKPSGAGSEVTATYRAAGYMPGGFAAVAPLVDRVLGTQWSALKKAAEAR